MRNTLLALALTALPTLAAAAPWECIDNAGNKRYTNIQAEAAGCTPIKMPAEAKEAPLSPYTSRFFSLEHGARRFDSAMRYATRYCAQAKLQPKHLGTDTPPGALSISRFECTNQ